MTLEYDGTNYAGWQRQANAMSVQQKVEEALEHHLGETVRVTASGRTDAGVHALGQVISFKTRSAIPADAVGRGLIQYLPEDISVRDSRDAAGDFDARKSARLRWYRFFLCNRRIRPAVGRNYVTLVKGKLDLAVMQHAADILSGEHDFSAFRSVACSATRTRLTMHPISVRRLPDDIIQLDFRCRSFLHNMVRILTGTMVGAGTGKISLDDIRNMISSGNRHTHAVTVAPGGLFLYRVFYDEDLDEAQISSSTT